MQETTNRIPDVNGWIEIKGNPISKVGVFPYYGWQIDDSLDPDRIYQVYRSAEELSDPECMDSFRLIPWTIDHEMLGDPKDGLTAAEEKGVSGVTGEDIYFESPYLKSNLKVFSSNMAQVIENNQIKELSIGYRCAYNVQSGVYDGQPFDAKQVKIRGNHLALVPEGRSGHDVAVMDSKTEEVVDTIKFTFDSARLVMADKEFEEKEKKVEDDASEMLTKKEEITENHKQMDESEEEKEKKKAEDEAEEEEKKKAEDEAEEEKKEKKEGMDAQIQSLQKQIQDLKKFSTKSLLQEISKRDSLASELSQHVGTFDHREKTLDEVAKYGIKKLGLKCAEGQEAAMLTGFLAGRKAPSVSMAQDSAPRQKNDFDKYLRGEI